MNNQKHTTTYLWQQLKAFASRLFAMLKLCFGAIFVGLMFAITHYVELRAVVLSVLDEQTVNSIKEIVEVIYGSSSVLFALEQTAILVLMPALGFVLRAVCSYAFVSLVIWLLCAVSKINTCNSKVILPSAPQCDATTHSGDKWLTLCKFIC